MRPMKESGRRVRAFGLVWLALVAPIGCGSIVPHEDKDASPAPFVDATPPPPDVAEESDAALHGWAIDFGEAAHVSAVVTDSVGDPIVMINGFGFPELPTACQDAGYGGIFVGKYGAVDGVLAWSSCFPSGSGTALAIDSHDALFLAGGKASGPGSGALLALTKDGKGLWTASFGAPDGNLDVSSVALDSIGNVYVAGHTDGPNDFGGDPYSTVGSAFVLSLDPTGKQRWVRHYGDDGNALISGLVALKDGSLRIVGATLGTSALVLGDGVSVPKKQTFGFYVAALDGGTGTFTWAKTFGGVVGSVASATSMISMDDVLLVGGVAIRTLTLGSDVVACGNGCGPHGELPFVASLDADATPQWASALSTPGSDGWLTSLAVDHAGDVVAMGNASVPNVDWVRDAVGVFSLSNGAGAPSSDFSADAENASYPSAIAASAQSLFVAGMYRGTMRFGDATLSWLPTTIQTSHAYLGMLPRTLP